MFVSDWEYFKDRYSDMLHGCVCLLQPRSWGINKFFNPLFWGEGGKRVEWANFQSHFNRKPKARYTLFANMTNRGIKLFFRRIKYCWQKRDERVALHCSLFAINFSCSRRFFFHEKVLCVRRWDCYPNANPAYGVQRKTCSRNMANAFYRLFAVRRFLSFRPYFAVVCE